MRSGDESPGNSWRNHILTTQRKRRGIAAAIAAVLAVFGLIAYLNVGTASADESTCTPITGFEQPLCDANAEIPEEDELRPALQTERDGAVFWTGRVNGKSVEQRAADFAIENNGLTLELALLEADIVMPPFADRSSEAERVWKLASNLFAEQASGTAFVVMGPELRPNNVFETIEFPALKNNPEIDRVIKVDAVTEEQTELFFRDEEQGGEEGDEGNDKRDNGPAFAIITGDPGNCVDTAEAENGATLTLRGCNNTDRQLFTQDADGKLVSNFDQNLCLDTRAGEFITTRPTILADCGDAPGWSFRDNTGFLNADGTGLCLTTEGRSADEGLEVVAENCVTAIGFGKVNA
jgi:hypothetical protein